MNKDVKFWLKNYSKNALSKIGIKQGMKVLDFGAREGYYTIPAAEIVELDGKVIAVDKNKKALKDLKDKVSRYDLKNIEIVNNKGKLELKIANNSIDFILLFDVFHELKNKDNLLKELHRILKSKGIISIYDPHMRNKNIKNKVMNYNFYYTNDYKLQLLHNYKLTKGTVNNFKK